LSRRFGKSSDSELLCGPRRRGATPKTQQVDSKRLFERKGAPFLAEKAFWASKNNAKKTGLEQQAACLGWKPHPNYGSNSAQFWPQKRIAEKFESSTYC
jgi:hypothetical protein